MILRTTLTSLLILTFIYATKAQSYVVTDVKFVEHSAIEKYYQQNFEESLAISPFMQKGMEGELKGMRFEINKNKDKLELTYHQGSRSGTKILKRVSETLYKYASDKSFQEVSYADAVPVVRRGSYKSLSTEDSQLIGYDQLHEKYGAKLPVHIMELHLKAAEDDMLQVKATYQVTQVDLRKNEDVMAFLENEMGDQNCPFYQQISDKQRQNTYINANYELKINGQRAHIKSYKDENSMISFSGPVQKINEKLYRVNEAMLHVTYDFILSGNAEDFDVNQIVYQENLKIPDSVKNTSDYQSLAKKYDGNLTCSQLIMKTKRLPD